MKNYLTFINENLVLSDLPQNKEWQIKIVKETISKIEIEGNEISIRKSDKYINNIIINSDVCKMYVDYYKMSENYKVKNIPVPKRIYEIEDIFDKLDKELILAEDKIHVDSNLYKIMLEHTKEYLVWVSYFPHILEYRDKQLLPHFKTTFFEYLRKPFNMKDILDNQGLVNHHLFGANSFDEYRSYYEFVESLKKELNNLIRISKYYNTHYNKYKDLEREEQIFQFLSFCTKYDAYMHELFDKDYVAPNRINDLLHSEKYIVGLSREDIEKIKNINIVFTGDFKTDYQMISKAINRR